MAKFDTQGLNEVAAFMLKQDEATLKVVPEMLKAGGEIIKKAQQTEINAMFNSDRSTGALKESIKVSDVKNGENGSKKVEIYPDGKDKHGVRNATKGFVLNYGRSNMPARPWFTAAMNTAADKATEAMRKVWEGRL